MSFLTDFPDYFFAGRMKVLWLERENHRSSRFAVPLREPIRTCFLTIFLRNLITVVERATTHSVLDAIINKYAKFLDSSNEGDRYAAARLKGVKDEKKKATVEAAAQRIRDQTMSDLMKESIKRHDRIFSYNNGKLIGFFTKYENEYQF
jgi:hypothetical protein